MKNTKINKIGSSQILHASVLGNNAFKNGKQRIPCQDAELLNIFGNRPVGITPDGEASTISIMNAWIKAWDDANLAKCRNQ